MLKIELIDPVFIYWVYNPTEALILAKQLYACADVPWVDDDLTKWPLWMIRRFCSVLPDFCAANNMDTQLMYKMMRLRGFVYLEQAQLKLDEDLQFLLKNGSQVFLEQLRDTPIDPNKPDLVFVGFLVEPTKTAQWSMSIINYVDHSGYLRGLRIPLPENELADLRVFSYKTIPTLAVDALSPNFDFQFFDEYVTNFYLNIKKLSCQRIAESYEVLLNELRNDYGLTDEFIEEMKEKFRKNQK